MINSTPKPRKVVYDNPIKGAIFIFIMIVIPITLSFLFVLDSFEPIGESTGTLVELYQRQTEEGSPTQFVVKLDSGERVLLDTTNMGAYKAGRRVIVKKWRSKWFRRIHYTFKRYVEIPDGIQPMPYNNQ